MRHDKLFFIKKNEKFPSINDIIISQLPSISLFKKINTKLYYASGSVGHLMDDNNDNDGEYDYDKNNLDHKSHSEQEDIDSNFNSSNYNNNIIENDAQIYFDDNEVYNFKKTKKKPLVTVKKKKPYSGPWPYEFTFVEDILPNPTQGKSWIINFIIDALKIAWRIKETLFGFMDP